MTNTSPQEQNKIDVVITSYHRPQFTWKCLDQIAENTKHPHRVIVIDNGSDEETQDMLWECREQGLVDILILLDRNYGLEPAKNYALPFVQSELYVDMDNDIYVSEGWLGKLLELKDKYPEYAAIAAHPQEFIGDDITLLLNDENEIREYSKCGASARLMDTGLVRKVGGWRNQGDMKTLTRGEEFYICGKLRAEGKKVGYARDVEVYHSFGKENWGYRDDVEHYHNPVWPIPKDSDYE